MMSLVRQRFLVTGANGDIGEAIGRILCERFPEASVEGADASGVWPAQAIFRSVHRLPLASAPDYIDSLLKLARHGFTAIFPTSEAEIERLVRDAALVDALPLVLSQRSVVATFLDKLETAHWLNANGFNSPPTFLLSEASTADLPLLLKPRRGSGGRNQEVIRTPARLDLAKAERDNFTVAQQLLEIDDEEYTCAVMTFDDQVRSIVMRRRLGGGQTVRAEVVHKPIIDVMLEALARKAKPQGPLNVQLRLMPNGPMIFEINPRFSSSVMMRHRFGFEDVIWALDHRRGAPMPAFKPPIGAVAYRLAREIIVSPDAIVGSERVNS